MDGFVTKLAAVCAALLVLPADTNAQANDEPITIAIDADFSSLDRQTNRGSFEGLRLTVEPDGLLILADEASVTGIDANSGRWELAGNVEVSLGTMLLQADRATFTFGDDSLISGVLAGTPAVFEDRGEEGRDPVVGNAERLSYSNAEGIVRLEGEVSLTAGANRITGCDVVYDLNQERVSSGASDCGVPFRITIIPPAEETSTSDTSVEP